MSAALAFLAGHRTAVLVVLAIATLVVLAYLGFLLLRARWKQDDGAKEGVEEEVKIPAPMAMVTQVAELEVTFPRAMKALRSVTSGMGYRYKTPWCLMLGQPGTGKTTLLGSLPLPRRVQRDNELASAHPVGWHFFDGGIVLDVAGNLTLKRDLSSDEIGWRRLLSLLNRYRSERPVDGVVLTLSAADLLAWEHRPVDELRAIGKGLFSVLRQAQHELGVRFPVYVVLTHADRLPGFTSFVSAIPKRFHQDIFGWSTPYALDAAFRSEWVNEALDDVSDRLRSRSTEALASRGMLADADAVFRFPEVIGKLVPAARTILSGIFEESAYHEAFFLRGIYFTGQKEQALPTAVPPAEDGTTRPVELDVYGAESALFGARIFAKKIFQERGLARGFRRGILNRNRSVRWLQLAVAALVIIGLPGMWIGHTRLEAKARPLESLLGSVEHNLLMMSAARAPLNAADSLALTQKGAESVVFSLLQQMVSLNAGPFWSVFLPTSWFSDIDKQIAHNLTTGFQDVILPTLRRGIVEWTDTLSDKQWAETIGGRVRLDNGTAVVRSSQRFQEYEALVRYLSEIRQFTQSAGRFNRIAQRGSSDVKTFSDLYVWYYEKQLPQEFFDNDAFYKEALSSATVTPVSASEWRGLEAVTAQVATQLADRFYGRLADAVGGLERGFAGTADPDFTAADLRVLWQNVGQVQDLLTSSDTSWFDADAPVPPALRAELDSIPQSSLFSKSDFVTRFTEGFGEVRRHHLADLSRKIELLSRALPADTAGHRVGTGTRLEIAPRLTALRSALGELLDRGFMTPTPTTGGQVRPTLAGRPTWNVAPLDEAVDYFAELQSFRDGDLSDIPPQLRGLVLGVAGRSLEERVRWCLDRAMTYEVGVGPEGRRGLEEDLKKRLTSFDAAARRLVGMLEIDDKMGGTPAGAAVAETIILEGSDLLNQVDELLDRDGLYQPVNGNLAVWQGSGPVSLVGFGATDADGLEAYLTRQREDLRTLANYAAPTLGYFSLQPVADLLRTDGPDLVPNTDEMVRKWRGIIRTLDDYDKKTPGNSLEVLEQFIRQGMAVSSITGCSTVASPVPPGAHDYFENVALRLSHQLTDRCRQLARQALLQGYTEMSGFFKSRLAGRFPFVDLGAQPDAPDADVPAVREFLSMYERVTAPLSGDPANVIDRLLGGEVPGDFFRQVGEVHDFLMPALTADEKGAPPLYFKAYLRTNRRAERGGDQIVDWRLTVGGRSVSYRDGSGDNGLWRPGDSTAVSLTWASESDRRPVADAARPDITVDGATITWRYAGPWSLLRMLADHRPAAADVTGSPADDRGTANLRVVTRSRDARSEPRNSREAVASVFLRLGFSATADGAELGFPRFPTRVPVESR